MIQTLVAGVGKTVLVLSASFHTGTADLPSHHIADLARAGTSTAIMTTECRQQSTFWIFAPAMMTPGEFADSGS